MNNVERTELIWAGKYDDQGQPRPVERTILPFQVVETVNESKADREKTQRDLFTKQAHNGSWRNMLIWGDNKVVMSSLLPRLAGKINLIYIDPPFATGQDFSFRVRVGDEEFVKEPSIIEEKAYRDTWGRGLASYLQMMYERLVLMRELLAEDGSIYVHVGPNVSHYVKLKLDEIFGTENFKNEIIWERTYNPGSSKARIKGYPINHDVMLYYQRSEAHEPSKVYQPYSEKYIRQHYRYEDERGRYRLEVLRTYSDGTYRRLESEGRIVKRPTSKYPYYKQYLHEMPGVLLHDIWTGIYLGSSTPERSGFDTQKPETLLERIITVSSKEGDLVADFFCGSGTTLAVAEKLGRRWIGCDLSKWAIQVTRKRLLQIGGCKPFEIFNLGNYERHKLAANGHWERYVQFILDLYRAEPVTGFKTLHGKKARAYVHVGSVDSPVTMREIRQTLKEVQEAGVREVHFLGWDFEMGLHDLVSEVGDDHGVKVRLVSIPREALEVTNPAREEVRFFDLNFLELEREVKDRAFTVRLKDFIIANPEYLPDEVRDRIKKFTDYIDYWAVDWDYHDDTFHNGWQSFRTRKDPKLETKATHTYDQPGTYKVRVKVVDIFGNDTTKMVEAKVP